MTLVVAASAALALGARLRGQFVGHGVLLAALASYVPALRASAVDPAESLAAE